MSLRALIPIRGPLIETFLAAVILAGIVYNAVFVVRFGYLPSPFFFEPADTFADWFNTAFWSRQSGAYDSWRTIYPPLSFVFLRYLGVDHCYPSVRDYDPSAGLAARDCDWLGFAVMGTIFVLNVILTWMTFRKFSPRTAPMRTVCVAMGMPMLDGLERGNLIMVAYTCVLLATGPLLASARLRWIFAGLALNFKLYLIGGFVALLLKKRWLWVEGVMLCSVIIYLVTFAIHGSGSPFEIYENVSGYAQSGQSQIIDLWHSVTYLPLMSVIELGTFPLSSIIGSVWVDRLEIILPALQRLTQLLIIMAAAAIWFRPGAFAPHRAIVLGMMMVLITSESGMYTQIFFMLYVLMEPWKGFGRIWAIVICYILAIPLDIPIDILGELVKDTYFTQSTTIVVYQLSLAPLVRPLMIMSVCWAIAFVTLSDLLSHLQREETVAKTAVALK